MCVVTQLYRDNPLPTEANNLSSENDLMYLIGGFAGWPRDDSRWNGDRTRNDVWVTADGKEWERVLPPLGQNTMPFVGRGWHACTTLPDPKDRGTTNLNPINDATGKNSAPKIYLSGGGYMGTKGNENVRTLEGYVDMWWSDNGSKWTRVNHEEGFKDSLYSTNEWTSTLINGKYVHRGKWGHSMEAFTTVQDLNNDEVISNKTSIDFCAGTQLNMGQCKTFLANEEEVPSLFVMGGDTTDGGPIVNDVFVSRPGGTL